MLSPDVIKEIQGVIGIILYYAHAVNITVLMALSSIAIKQTKGTTSTTEKAKQLLNYLVMNPNATMRFKASDMIMNVHLDALSLFKANARSCVCGHFFMGWEEDQEPGYATYERYADQHCKGGKQFRGYDRKKRLQERPCKRYIH
jgi:hypothetical protein